MRSNTRTYALLFLGMATFGSATPVSKIVTLAMPVFIGSGLRVALGAVVLALAVGSAWTQVRSIGVRDWVRIALIALFGMFGFSVLMLYGMKWVSGVVGAIVMSTTPAVTALGAILFMKDAPTWRKLAAIALAVGGVLILQIGGDSGSSGGHPWLGALLVFGAVCCEASYTLLGKKASEDVDPVLLACLGALLAVPLFVPFAIWQWPRFEPGHVDVRDWSALVWYGAGTLALGSWLWYSGVRKTEGSIAAGFMGVMPATALILSYVLLGEPFRWLHVFGFATVFLGVLLISWEHARMAR